MRNKDQGVGDASVARGLIIALTALLCVVVIGFYLTGPINKVPMLANAPPAGGTIGQHH